MPVSYGTGARGKATKLHAALVRSRGKCERCGRTPPDVQLQCAHIVSRRYAAIRTSLLNAWCLCYACHRFLTENPHEHVALAVQTRGRFGYDELIRQAYDGVGKKLPKGFWESEVERLEGLLKSTTSPPENSNV